MAKRRILKPFYGKLNQRLEQTGRQLARQGQHEAAKEMFDRSDKILTIRKHAARGGR